MPTSTYWRNVALKAVVNSPREDIVYAVFTECLTHLKDPQERFVIYPQLSLKWKPYAGDDKRAEVPDVGVGNFTHPGASPTFKLRLGVEAKRSTETMQSLPPPSTILAQRDVVAAFNQLLFQAKNQAKAAIKNSYPITNNTVDWILLVGPYWRPCTFGPFTEAELEIRAHKPSPSADWLETLKEKRRTEAAPLALQELFLLSEEASFRRLEALLASTQPHAQPLINAMM
jgi:hypothetical protein